MAHLWKWCDRIFYFLLLVAAGFAIGSSARATLTAQSGLANEGEFLILLAVWVFIWGIIAAIVGVVYFAYDLFNASWGWFFNGLSLVLLSGPWLLIGQIELARAFTSVDAAHDWVYAMAWIGLVLSYLNVPLAWFRMNNVDLLDYSGASKKDMGEYGESVEPLTGPGLAKRTQGKYTYE